METGTVKWFDAAKGFGFVIPQDSSPDVYVKGRVLQKASLASLEAGSVIHYTVIDKAGRIYVSKIALVSAPSRSLWRWPSPRSRGTSGWN